MRVAGVINAVTLKKDRKGKPMAFITVEDLNSDIEVVVFSKVYERCLSSIKEGALIGIEGKVDKTTDPPKLVAQNIYSFSKIKSMPGSFHIQLDPENWRKDKLEKIKGILEKGKGGNSVYLHFKGSNGESIVVKSKSLKVDFSEQLIRQIEELIGDGKCWLGER